MKRIEYLDFAKGILIILVLFNHICWQVKNNGISNNFIDLLMSYFFLYTPFFMSTFFMITGLCSNYNKRFSVFLHNKIKTLIIPALFLGFIQNLISLILKYPDSLEFKSLIWMFIKMISELFFNGGQYWFLSSIFIANLLFWGVYNFIKNDFLKFTIIILLYTIGTLLFNNGYSNIWSVQQALLLIPFIYLGNIFNGKEFSNKYIFLFIIYILSILVLSHYDISIAYVAAKIKFNTTISPIVFILLASLGGISIILLSKIMCMKLKEYGKSIIYIGKNSIIYYTLNWTIFDGLIFLCRDSLKDNSCYNTFFILIMIFITTIYFINILSVIINLKYVNFIIGKF